MYKVYAICVILILLLFSCSSNDQFVLEEETPESLLAKSRAAYDNGNYDESMKMAKLLLEHFPTSDLHVEAQLVTAKSMGGNEKFEDQMDLLLRLLKENIIPEKVPLIYVQIAEFYEDAAVWNPGNVTSDTSDFIKAAKFYRKAVFYPNSNDDATKSYALYRTGFMYTKAKDIVKAKQAYGQVVDSYPQSPYAALARQKLLDPTNTEDIQPEPMIASQQEGTSTGLQTDASGGSIADSLGLNLPVDEDESPVIIDTTQAIIPE
jgi:tetratricopeptide (TPR) repeat protein